MPEADVEVLGQLDDTVTATSNYLVRPYVGALRPGLREFTTAPREVSELLRVPLEHLLSPAGARWHVVERDGCPTPTPAYRYGDYVIWGATARGCSASSSRCSRRREA